MGREEARLEMEPEDVVGALNEEEIDVENDWAPRNDVCPTGKDEDSDKDRFDVENVETTVCELITCT